MDRKPEPNVKMTLHVGSAPVVLSSRYTIGFENNLNGEPVPVLFLNGKRVKKSVRLLMNVFLPGAE